MIGCRNRRALPLKARWCSVCPRGTVPTYDQGSQPIDVYGNRKDVLLFSSQRCLRCHLKGLIWLRCDHAHAGHSSSLTGASPVLRHIMDGRRNLSVTVNSLFDNGVVQVTPGTQSHACGDSQVSPGTLEIVRHARNSSSTPPTHPERERHSYKGQRKQGWMA